MTHSPSQPAARSRRLLCDLPVFVSAALLLSGCSLLRRPKPSIPWATAVQVRPMLQPRPASASAADPAAPDLFSDAPPFAVILIPLPSAPLRPRVGSPTAPAPVADPEKPGVPTIAPQLTAQESAAAQQEAIQSLDIAERNLAAAQGKRLNPAQTDLVSKIKGFLKDAREAAQTGDWERARNLAKKAQVLSEELVRSV